MSAGSVGHCRPLTSHVHTDICFIILQFDRLKHRNCEQKHSAQAVSWVDQGGCGWKDGPSSLENVSCFDHYKILPEISPILQWLNKISPFVQQSCVQSPYLQNAFVSDFGEWIIQFTYTYCCLFEHVFLHVTVTSSHRIRSNTSPVSAGGAPMTARHMDSLIRLAEANARIELRHHAPCWIPPFRSTYGKLY